MKLSLFLPILGLTSLVAAGLQRRQTETSQVPTTTRSAQSSTPATITSSPSRSQAATSTSAATTTTAPPIYNTETGSEPDYYGSGNNDGADTDAGASGSTGGFTLSKGGLIAICVVVAIVVILGAASTVLFIVAKRRQWNIRESIRRASRRFTGRGQKAAASERPSRRVGLQMSAQPAQHGHKRGLMVEVNDIEKGSSNSNGKIPAKHGSKWYQRNDWKR